MRHLRSIIYTLVLAPAVWILCGVGFDQDLTGRARDNGGIESLFGVLLLLLAGAAYAILLFSPISPAGPLLAGLVLAGIGAWARIAPDSYAAVWPANVTGEGFDVSTPGYGLAVLLAVPMLGVALSARRWRGYEPPEILLIGTIGRARGAARVAGTPMAAEWTTVLPQQRQVPAFPPGFRESADATQVVTPARPVDDGDEKTTVIPLGRPPAPVPAQRSGADEPTRIVPPAAAAEQATEDIARSEEPTRDVVPAPAEDKEEETTRLVLPPAGSGAPATAASVPVTEDEDEKTQLLTLPRAHGDEQTEAVRTATVEPPGDRTQVLTFRPPAPSPPTAPSPPVPSPPVPSSTVPDESLDGRESTKAMSIAGAERPDPGADPTTRLTVPGGPPGEETTRATPQVPAMTVTGSERPADEAADDTRPLTLPAPRPPVEEDTTRRL